MTDILQKQNSLRTAIAEAHVVVSKQETIAAIKNKVVPKGDVLEFSRAAGLLAIKKTSDVIPDCHPLPIEYANITYSFHEMQVSIRVEVSTIYKTGVEVEAMHGASVTALTMYDMLKPIDKEVEIKHIKLISKSGGKTSFANELSNAIKAAVVVCSDSVSAGKKEDKAGKRIVEKLTQHGIVSEHYSVIPDEPSALREKIMQLVTEKYALVLFCGGTGLSPRDITPDTIQPLLEREIPGMMEAARAYGQQRTPYAMLSRGVAGMIQNTLVITLPGSSKGATESMDALFPYVKHIFVVAQGMRHD
jgi:cyclic pyranopterin phosphate synthase